MLVTIPSRCAERLSKRSGILRSSVVPLCSTKVHQTYNWDHLFISILDAFGINTRQGQKCTLVKVPGTRHSLPAHESRSYIQNLPPIILNKLLLNLLILTCTSLNLLNVYNLRFKRIFFMKAEVMFKIFLQ